MAPRSSRPMRERRSVSLVRERFGKYLLNDHHGGVFTLRSPCHEHLRAHWLFYDVRNSGSALPLSRLKGNRRGMRDRNLRVASVVMRSHQARVADMWVIELRQPVFGAALLLHNKSDGLDYLVRGVGECRLFWCGATLPVPKDVVFDDDSYTTHFRTVWKGG